jgi:hypothetical protein
MSQFASRLPEDPAYWDRLAARIGHGAEPLLRDYRDARAWWQPLATWSPAIGVAAAAAALIVAVLGPPAPTRAPVSLEQMLAPSDPVAQAVAGGAAAPDITVMLLIEGGGRP